MSKLATVVTLTAAAAFGAVIIGGTANAISTSFDQVGIINHATTSYSSPSTDSSPVHVNLVPGERANVVCWTDGQSIDNNTRWFRIDQDGKIGFVSGAAISPPHFAPHC